MPCEEQFTAKYKARNSPPYPAQDCRGMILEGNDGNLYLSKPNKNDIASWKIHNSPIRSKAKSNTKVDTKASVNSASRYQPEWIRVVERAINDLKNLGYSDEEAKIAVDHFYVEYYPQSQAKSQGRPQGKPRKTYVNDILQPKLITVNSTESSELRAKPQAKPRAKPQRKRSVPINDLLDHAALTGCANGKIRNPETNRCIAIGGKLYNQLAAAHGNQIFFQ